MLLLLVAVLHAVDVARTARGGPALAGALALACAVTLQAALGIAHAALSGAARARARASGDGDRGAHDRGRASGAARTAGAASTREPAAAVLAARMTRRLHPAATGRANVIEISHQDDVAILRMAHGKANAMSIEFCQALTAAVGGARARRRRGPS